MKNPCVAIFSKEKQGVKQSYAYEIRGYDGNDMGMELDIFSAKIIPLNDALVPSCVDFSPKTGDKIAAMQEAHQSLRDFFKNMGFKEESDCP